MRDGHRLMTDAFVAAPFVEHGWDIALRALADATGANRGQLLALRNARHAHLGWITDEPPGYLDDFAAIDAGNPRVNWRIAAAGRPLEITHEAHYAAIRARGTDPGYEDHIHRFDASHGCQAVLLDEPHAFFGLAVLRSEREGRTDAYDRAVFADAMPFVLDAIRTQGAIEGQGIVLMRGSLEAVGAAALLLDGRGAVCGMTPAAEAVIARGVLRIRGHLLSTRERRDDAGLQAMIADALRRQPSSPRQSLWVSIPETHGRMLIQAFALPRSPGFLGFGPAVLVTLRTPLDDARAARAETIAQAFDLTPAESEIAEMLATGVSRATIARARGTSPQTLASQLKVIFRKCDVRREAELVARLAYTRI